MGDNTKIEWTDASWNPLRGCTRVSEGCRWCYAEGVAARFSGPGQPYEGLARMVERPDGSTEARWTGEVRLVENQLTQPRRWKRPRRVFVNSMSDLFHEKVPDGWIDRIFAVMALSPKHTFQCLSKRPERMLAYMKAATKHPINGGWPLKNVWLGVSVEDQGTANARIPLLLQTPAAIRFVSYEPALGPVDFRTIEVGYKVWRDAIKGYLSSPEAPPGPSTGNTLDWIIVGGESGRNARPFDVLWAGNVVEQCRGTKTKVFVKQLGLNPMFNGNPMTRGIYGTKGEGWLDWPEMVKVREYPA